MNSRSVTLEQNRLGVRILTNGWFVHEYLDTGNAKSTGNLHKHAKICWGEQVVAATVKTCNVQSA